MSSTNPDQPKEVKRYKWEYRNFLEFVQKRKVSRAVIYAKTLGIDRRTMVHWLSQPELRDAMAEAIDELVDGMQRAGSKDWRMYRELMEIMGVDKEQKIDITTDGQKLQAATVVDLGALHADKSKAEQDSGSGQEPK